MKNTIITASHYPWNLLPKVSMNGIGHAIIFSRIGYLKLNKIQLFVITQSLYIQRKEKLFSEMSKACMRMEDHLWSEPAKGGGKCDRAGGRLWETCTNSVQGWCSLCSQRLLSLAKLRDEASGLKLSSVTVWPQHSSKCFMTRQKLVKSW